MKKLNTKPRVDLYEKITSEIIGYLSAGVRPWVKSWKCGTQRLPLRATGEPYRGINVLILWGAQIECGYRCNTWMTYRQAVAVGANVRKGEKGQLVVYSAKFEKEDAERETRAVSFLRQYVVFNFEQIENLPDDYAVRIPSGVEEGKASEGEAMTPNDADAVLIATGATINHGGGQPYYAPGPDAVQMPDFDTFRDADAYTATLAHELVHWTGAAHRLDRKFDSLRLKEDTAREELVAEIGAAFVCAQLGVAAKEREDHARYIDHWLTLLKGDKKAVVKAAALAQKAADYMLAEAACEEDTGPQADAGDAVALRETVAAGGEA
ncbi:MAG: zincin-like metallopeptidase domain-containing protein [Burkholderiaceae bacterium]